MRSVVDRNVVMLRMTVLITCFRISAKRRFNSFWQSVHVCERTKQTDCHSNGISNENLHTNAVSRRITIFITPIKQMQTPYVKISVPFCAYLVCSYSTTMKDNFLGDLNSAYFAGEISRPVLSPSTILPPPSAHCAFTPARKNTGYVSKILPYFSIDNAHLMYNAHPKLFRHSFWCIDNAHDVFFDR